MKIVKRKKGGFYGLGNAGREGNEVIIPPPVQTVPPQQDLERTTIQTMNTIAPKTVKLGESVSVCGGMSLESMLLIGGAVALVGFIAHYATK